MTVASIILVKVVKEGISKENDLRNQGQIRVESIKNKAEDVSRAMGRSLNFILTC